MPHRYENDSSKTFEDNWGFLKGKKDDEPTAYSTKLAKYFNPQGGTWTVRQKRIPFMFEQKKDQEEESLGTGALHIAKEAHTVRIAAVPSNPTFIPTSEKIGARGTLEIFGTSHHGREATRTQLPSN